MSLYLEKRSISPRYFFVVGEDKYFLKVCLCIWGGFWNLLSAPLYREWRSEWGQSVFPNMTLRLLPPQKQLYLYLYSYSCASAMLLIFLSTVQYRHLLRTTFVLLLYCNWFFKSYCRNIYTFCSLLYVVGIFENESIIVKNTQYIHCIL